MDLQLPRGIAVIDAGKTNTKIVGKPCKYKCFRVYLISKKAEYSSEKRNQIWRYSLFGNTKNGGIELYLFVRYHWVS